MIDKFSLNLAQDPVVVIEELGTYLRVLHAQNKNKRVALLPLTLVEASYGFSYRTLCKQLFLHETNASDLYNVILRSLYDYDMCYQQEVSRNVLFRVLCRELEQPEQDSTVVVARARKARSANSEKPFLDKGIDYLPNDCLFYSEMRDGSLLYRGHTLRIVALPLGKGVIDRLGCIQATYGVREPVVKPTILVCRADSALMYFQDFLYESI